MLLDKIHLETSPQNTNTSDSLCGRHEPGHITTDADESPAQLHEFQESFALTVSNSKTFLWGSDMASLVPLAEIPEKWGYAVRDTVPSLGTEWAIRPSVKSRYEKEVKRISTARDRLARLAHLPSRFWLKRLPF